MLSTFFGIVLSRGELLPLACSPLSQLANERRGSWSETPAVDPTSGLALRRRREPASQVHFRAFFSQPICAHRELAARVSAVERAWYLLQQADEIDAARRQGPCFAAQGSSVVHVIELGCYSSTPVFLNQLSG